MTLLTVSVLPLAVIFTLPEVDLTSPLISPVWVVIFTLPVVALMVVPALVVTFPADAVIFTVLLEVMLLFTSTFFCSNS